MTPIMLLGISGLAGSGKDTVASFLVKDLAFTTLSLADPLKRIARDVYDFTDDQLWGPSASRNAPDTRYPRPHSYDDNHSCLCCGWNSGSLVRDESEFSNPPQCYLTPRYALQLLGTEWGRECYPDTWASMCVRTANRLNNHTLRYDKKKGIHSVSETREWAEADRQEESRVMAVSVPDVRFKNEIRIIREAGGKVLRVKRPGAGLKGATGVHQSEKEQAGIPDEDFDAVIENTGSLEELRRASFNKALSFAMGKR